MAALVQDKPALILSAAVGALLATIDVLVFGLSHATGVFAGIATYATYTTRDAWRRF